MNLQDKLNELNVAGTFNSEETPQHKRIKILENELDKIIIKYNEAQSIKKTYEQIVKKIKEERVGFDNQIKIIKKTLKSKEKDLVDLTLLANKAIHAKEISLHEFKIFKKEQEKIKKKQKEYIDQKKAEIDQKLQKIDRKQSQQQKENEEALEEEQKKIQRLTMKNDPTRNFDMNRIKEEINIFQQAFKEIYKNTGAVDINEIIQKYIVQEETKNSLQQLQDNYLDQIQQQEQIQIQLKKEIEQLKESFDIREHKKQIEGIDRQTSDTNRKLQEEKNRCEKVTDTLIQFQSGIEHLYNKLQFVELEENINFNNEDELPLIKMIKNLNQKIKVVYEEVKKDQRASKIFKKNFSPEENLIVFQNFVDPNLYVEHCIHDQPIVQTEKGIEECPSEEDSKKSEDQIEYKEKLETFVDSV